MSRGRQAQQLARVSARIRRLTDERADAVYERRHLMLALERDRHDPWSIEDLIAVTGIAPSNVTAQLRKAREEARVAPIPRAARRHRHAR